MFISLSLAGFAAILISIFVARQLGAEDFGMYSITISLQAVIALLGSFSIGTAMAKYVSEYRVRDHEQALRVAKSGLTLVLAMAAAVGIIYSALAGVIGRGLYKEGTLVEIIPYSALVVFSLSVFNATIGIVQGCQKFRLMAVGQICSPLLSLLLIFLLLPSLGIKGVFIGYFLSQLTVATVLIVLLNRGGFKFLGARLELQRSSPAVRLLFSFALPAVLGALMVTPIAWVANTELTLVAGFEAMGYFAVALVVYQALILIPGAVGIPVMPRISQLSVGSREEVEKLVARIMRTLSVALFPFLFAIALFAATIVQVLYGSRFSASAEAVYLIVFASYLYSLGSAVGTLITGLGRMWVGLGVNAFWAAVFLIFVFTGVPAFGTSGMGLAYAGSYGIFLIMLMAVSDRVLHIKVHGVYLAGASAAVFFVVGFLLLEAALPFELLAKVALLVGGTAYFYFIGRDVFRYMYLRVRNALAKPKAPATG